MAEIRRANQDDLAALLNIDAASDHWEWKESVHPSALADNRVLLATAQDQPIGYLRHGDFLWDEQEPFIQMVRVSEGFRRRGIATQLIKSFIEITEASAQDNLWAGVYSSVEADNKASIALHEKLGFTACGNPQKLLGQKKREILFARPFEWTINRELEERNLLNLAIWERVFDLISGSPNQKKCVTDPENHFVEAYSITDREETLDLPRIGGEALPPDELLDNITGQPADFYVMHLSLAKTITRNGIRVGKYPAYELHIDGRISVQAYEGTRTKEPKYDEAPESLGVLPDIDLTDRQNLLNELLAVESIE